MKVFDKLIRVSKKSINEKYFTLSEEEMRSKLSGDELKQALSLLPTQDELDFMEVFNSTIPQLARLQRKMSVCLDVEVLEMEEEFIKFEYGENIYRIEEPKNAYKICMALEKSSLEAFSELVLQGCVYVQKKTDSLLGGIVNRLNEKPIQDIRQGNVLKVDELNLLVKIADKFFFRSFMV